MKIEQYISLCHDNLLNDVIPFWLNNSSDDEYGGYFTCLDRQGNVFDTDKFIWLQCRQVWTFAMLYNQVEKKKEWLDFALQGADFLTKHGRDKEGNWYFSLAKEGKPLVQPYNIFSDCFAAMAYGQLYKTTGDSEHADIAKSTFFNILSRQHNPKGKYSKAFPGTRDLESFALPMIISNLVLEIEHILEPELVKRTIEQGIDTVVNKFYRSDLHVILENVRADGSLSDSFEGRLVNPGHGLEAMWFIMDLAKRTNDKTLIETISKNTKTILAVFASQYSLKETNLEAVGSIIIAFENSEVANEISAEIIFGESQAKGSLPASISKVYPVNSGVKISK